MSIMIIIIITNIAVDKLIKCLNVERIIQLVLKRNGVYSIH